MNAQFGHGRREDMKRTREFADWVALSGLAFAGHLAAALLVGCGGYDLEVPEDAGSPDEQAEETVAPEERLLGIEPDGTLRYGTEPDFVDLTPAAGELGQTSQPLVFASAGATQPGSRPDTSETCVVGDNLQNCRIFGRAGNAGMTGSNKMRYWVIGGNAGQLAALTTSINAFYNTAVAQGAITSGANGFKVEQGTSINDPALTVVFDLVTNSSGFCTGPNGKTRNNFCWSGQTQGLADGGMPGTYHLVLGVPVVHFDIGEIDARAGLTAAKRTNLKNQAYWASFATFYNIGLVVVGDNRCNNVDEKPDGCVWRSQQSCFINGQGEFTDLSGLWENHSVECGT
jgi:hypothetical protein